MKILSLFILLSTLYISINANGLGFLGCCGGPGPGPYPAGTMTPSGYPIYGMAPHASDSVAYSDPGSSYGYSGGSSGGYGNYGSSSGYGSYGGSGYSSYGGSSGGSGIDFDSIPYGSLPPGTNPQPIAIRYFSQAIPVDIDPARLRPLGPTQLMRMPVYGRVRSYQSEFQHQPSYNFYQSTPNYYRPGSGGSTSKYNKFAHSVESDISRGYQPAYSNWNQQPMQAVFRQAPESAPTPQGSSSSSGYSQHENIPPVSPAPAESSGFPDVGGSSNYGSSKAGSFQTGEASIPNQFRARAAAVRSTSTSQHAAELKPVSQPFPKRSTGAENYKLSGEVLEAVNAVLHEHEKALAH